MKRLLRLALITVTVSGAMLLASCATQTSTSSRSAAAEGNSESGSGNVPGTARHRAESRVELALGYYSRGQHQIALQELRTAAQADPGYAAVYNAFGLVYMALGEQGLAEESFQRGLKLVPNDSETNNNYGWFLCQNGRVKEAITRFEAALHNPLYQTPAVPLRNAGVCSLRIGETKAALEFLQRSFRIEPGNPVTMYQLADANYHAKEYERALFYVQRLNQQMDPSAESLWMELRIQHKLGNRDAEALLTGQLRKRFPDSAEASASLRGRYDE
jgi:type IV pilus assembly protein PilF